MSKSYELLVGEFTFSLDFLLLNLRLSSLINNQILQTINNKYCKHNGRKFISNKCTNCVV